MNFYNPFYLFTNTIAMRNAFTLASFATLVFIVITWIATFIMTGLHKDYVPLVSDNQSQVVGTVLFNYAFITTVPSWVNDLVSIKKNIYIFFNLFKLIS